MGVEEITWSDDFSVGIHAIDEQHKKIIKTINKLAAVPNVLVHSETISDVLAEMLRYTNEHLAFEEDLLEKHNYPDFENHKSGHLEYLEKVGDFSIEVMNHHQNVPDELLKYLCDWWTNHILHEDMQYRPFFEEKNLTL